MKLKNIYLFALLAFFACSDSEDTTINQCNECVVINNDLYNNTKTANYTITDIKLNGDLLTLKIGASGCDGNSWKATLIDADQILESSPIQRNIKLSLENNEFCTAFFEREFTFNVKILKEDFTQILLNLEGWNAQISYD